MMQCPRIYVCLWKEAGSDRQLGYLFGVRCLLSGVPEVKCQCLALGIL